MFHVITSLNRLQNLDKLYENLYPQDVEWHILADWSQWYRIEPVAPWVTVYHFENHGGDNFWARCHYALNWFLDHTELHKDHYYCFLNDDDAYEPGFFDKLRKVSQAKNDELMVTSMMRGHNIPSDVAGERRHGTNTLVAAMENMKPGYVGLEQVFVKGSLLRGARIPMTIDGDGRMIEWLVHSYTPTFIPDAYVWFNFWEPGRWNPAIQS